MLVLRWLLAAAVAAYGLAGLLPGLVTALCKLGLPVPDAAARFAPLMLATPWWQVAAEFAVTALLAAAAWRLARARIAFGLSLLAFAADAALWWIVHALPAYQLAFTSAELADDYAALGGMTGLLLAIWLLERSRSGPAAA